MRLQAAWRRIDFGPGERIAWAVTAALVIVGLGLFGLGSWAAWAAHTVALVGGKG